MEQQQTINNPGKTLTLVAERLVLSVAEGSRGIPFPDAIQGLFQQALNNMQFYLIEPHPDEKGYILNSFAIALKVISDCLVANFHINLADKY